MQQQQQVIIPPGFSTSDGIIVLIPSPHACPRGPPRKWNQSCAKGVGITITILAVAAFICNIGWFFLNDNLAFVGVGFWAGIPMAVTGLLITVGGFKPKRGIVISVLVMSIITVVLVIGFVVVGVFQIFNVSYSEGRDYYDGTYVNGTYTAAYDDSNSSTLSSSSIGMGSFYVCLGAVGFGLLITASILSCVSLCAGSSVSDHPITMTYIPQAFATSQCGQAYQTMYPPTDMKTAYCPMTNAYAAPGCIQQAPPCYFVAAGNTAPSNP